MPIFRLEDDKLIVAQETNIELERHIEMWIENSPWAVLQDELVLWINRQASAQDEEGTIFPDLLGVDSEGNLVIVEFKRGKTPRTVIAQLLEYAAWADDRSPEQIHDLADAYFDKRDEFRGKTFPEAFREVFDIPETDELPPLKRKLRLFVIAEEIQPRVAHVCRLLRRSYKMDVSCIAVSRFQTESGEEIVSTETKVGNEEIVTPKTRQQLTAHPSRSAGDKPVNQVLWEAVQELTEKDTNVVFTQKNILERYSSFNANTLRRVIIQDCANRPAPNNNIIINPDGKYWWIARGEYRLYDPEKDKSQKNNG
ncbi:MAG: hypothetical protein OXI61_08855 [Candidatus Poribacteria bacterium]|nr:hypothetical protein [Candidatus Poribacteria bacterium]